MVSRIDTVGDQAHLQGIIDCDSAPKASMAERPIALPPKQLDEVPYAAFSILRRSKAD
jgi:hypothetical protein